LELKDEKICLESIQMKAILLKIFGWLFLIGGIYVAVVEIISHWNELGLPLFVVVGISTWIAVLGWLMVRKRKEIKGKK
jgi:hypothetical protein